MKLKLKSYVNVERQLDDLLVTIIKGLLIIWGLMLLASWSWKVLLPRPTGAIPQIEVAKTELSERILNSHWFGRNGSPISTAAINFKLVGVFSPTAGKPGFAILKMADGKQRVALLNKEILPGIKLETLGANYIEVGQTGQLTKILLENRMPSQPSTIAIPLKAP